MTLGSMTYDAFKNGDAPVGGFVQPRNGQPDQWLSYLSVEDVDDACQSVEKAGGKVIAPPMDIPTVGRMAMLSDPEGVIFSVFRSGNADPPDEASAVGGFHWNELWAQDADKALAFYTKAFGFEYDEMPMPEGIYRILKKGGEPRAGILQVPSKSAPLKWLSYVHVNNTDETLKRAKGLGGTELRASFDVPGVGRIAIVTDPVGETIGIIHPAAK